MELEILKSRFDVQMGRLHNTINHFPWSDKVAYAGFMKQTYSFCRHTPTLLTLCAAHLMNNPKLQQRFAIHASEEFAHDKLAVSDIRALGYRLDEVATLPVMSAFVKAQYYWIERVSPQSFFGYILFLETLPISIGASVYEQVVEAHDEKSASFLRVHQIDDPDRIKNAWGFVDRFTGEQLQQVHDNLIESSENYIAMLKTLS